MIWTHHYKEFALEYYPYLTWLDINNDNNTNLIIPDPNYYADASLSAHVRIKMANGKKRVLVSPFGPSSAYVKASFSANGEFVFTLSGHTNIDIWRSYDGSYVATMLLYGKEDFLIIDKDQHYYTTNAELLKNVFIEYEGRVYPAAELDIFQNRPDIILEQLTFINNPELLKFYKNWVSRRQSFAGISSLNNGDRPLVTLNTDELPLATDNSVIDFSFGTSGKESIQKAYLWINNIKTDSINLDGQSVSGSFTTELQKGNNKVQVAVVNKVGLQSFRESFYINYAPSKKSGSGIYGAIIGVSKYSNPIYNLEYAAKDAGDLLGKLRGITNGKLVKLLDNDITASSLDSVAQSFEEITVNDLAIVYLAGHGALDKTGQFFFCTSKTKPEDPATNGISMQQLQSFFKNLKARKRILILDACHSGNTDQLQLAKTDLQKAPGYDSIGLSKRGFRLLKKQSATTISDRNYAEILKQQLLDANNAGGIHVFAATSGAGVAYESAKWGNGIFTSMLIKAIDNMQADENNDKRLDIKELVNFVIRKVKEETQDKQVPESGMITWDNNWIFIDN
jgi:hypothetical protein